MEKKLHATAANETDWRNKLTKTRIGSVIGYVTCLSCNS